jgi:hypothetical protein
MDPNNPGQPGEAPSDQPLGAPTTSPWGAPPAAPYGAQPTPPPPPGPPYGAPYGAPPYGDPNQPPYGAPPPAWGAPVPTAKRSPLPRIIAAVVVVVLIALAGAYVYSQSGVANKGKVLFSTTVPATGTHQGCTIDSQVTSVSAATPVYANYIWSSVPSTTATVTLTITKDGKAFPIAGLTSIDFPSDTAGTDCFSDTTDLSTLPNWGPGTYEFSVSSGGKVLADGSLTVK